MRFRPNRILFAAGVVALLLFADRAGAQQTDALPPSTGRWNPSLDVHLDFGSTIAPTTARDPSRFSLGALSEPQEKPPPAASPEHAAGSESAHTDGEDDASAIAKKLQNPVADLISLPIQWNLNTAVGPDRRDQSVINIQPVIPFHITEEWNLITRTIVPIINTPVPDWEFGLGDTQLQLYASPAKPSKFIWGAGPIFQFPTATDDALGQDKWCAGPTVVALIMEGPWVYGAVANQI